MTLVFERTICNINPLFPVSVFLVIYDALAHRTRTTTRDPPRACRLIARLAKLTRKMKIYDTVIQCDLFFT